MLEAKKTPATGGEPVNGGAKEHGKALDHKYTANGIRLVTLKPGTKQPAGTDWQRPGNGISSPEHHRLHGVGIHHLDSGTCCIDIDDWQACEEWMSKRGIDLTTLMMADDAV